VVAQVDGRRWLSMEGVPTVSDEPPGRRGGPPLRAALPAAERDPARVVVEIAVDRVLGSA
jgi:hypothetical protein